MNKRDPKTPKERGNVKTCNHPIKRQMYYQLNVNHELRITVADLLGGINPYVWRVEYCGDCRKVSKASGEVPAGRITRKGFFCKF